MERALHISSIEPSDFIHNVTQEPRVNSTLSVLNPTATWSRHWGGSLLALSPMTIGKGVARCQGPWQIITTTRSEDPATLTLGEGGSIHFPPSTHSPQGRGNFTILWSTVLGICSGFWHGDCVYFGDQLCIPRLPFSSALRSVKYSTAYYHFIWLQFFPLTVVRGSLDSESLPLSNSICLNVKKKGKKCRTFKNPSNLAFLRKYLIGVAFLKLCLLEAGAGKGGTGVENTFIVSFFGKMIFCS